VTDLGLDAPTSGTVDHGSLPDVAVVIGAGLIGASVGCALTGAGWRVHLRDHKLSHARVAAGLGAGVTEPPRTAEVGVVVVAIPPAAIPDVVGHALRTYPAATVTDVGSVKAGVLDALWDRDIPIERYVGSHPMAGSQRSGPMTASADLFEDRTWVITPHRRSSPASIQTVSAVVAACRARPVLMDVDEHDAAVARVSHLPHLLAVLMAGHLNSVPTADLLLAGQGLRDVTRVAGSDPDLWEQILSANSAAVASELRTVQAELSALIGAIESRPSQALRAQLERGVSGTRKIPGKHGAQPVSYRQVVVEIPDHPGALAHLFADVSAAGVNVEDVAIEHDEVREVGYLALSVAPDRADGLVAAMASRGWHVG
jgi:prephenate dehydrogenase